MTAKEITESSLDNILCTTLNYSFYHYHFIQLVIMSIHLRSQLCAYPSLSFLYLCLSLSILSFFSYAYLSMQFSSDRSLSSSTPASSQ